MQDLQIFSNAELGDVRVIDRNGEPWFVAADVCKALGLDQPHKALTRLDADEIGGGIEIPHPQNPDKTLSVSVVSEPGLYTLVLGSRKPQAKAFKRWVTHEVIPTIRKTGAYALQIANEQTLRGMIEKQSDLLEAMETIIAQMSKVMSGSPILMSAAASDIYSKCLCSLPDEPGQPMTLDEAAVRLMMKKSDLVNFLYYKKLIYRTNNNRYQPYKKMNNGLFIVELVPSAKKSGFMNGRTHITPKGMRAIRLLLEQEKGSMNHEEALPV